MVDLSTQPAKTHEFYTASGRKLFNRKAENIRLVEGILADLD
jgi:hypothetical protein